MSPATPGRPQRGGAVGILSPVQAASLRDTAGSRLPTVYPVFDRHKAHLRRGQVALIAAAPGGYKSVLALNLALKSKVGCLYLGMDSTHREWAARAASLIELRDDGADSIEQQAPWVEKALDHIPHVKVAFPSSPDIDEVVLRTFAYAEMIGEFPELIVVDNLMDLSFDGATETEGYTLIMDELVRLSRLSKACVLVLHHVTGEYENGMSTIPQSGLRYKVAKKPALVLTLSNDGVDLWVSVVKNRDGAADPSGTRVRFPLRLQPQFFQITDGGALN